MLWWCRAEFPGNLLLLDPRREYRKDTKNRSQSGAFEFRSPENWTFGVLNDLFCLSVGSKIS